ncbi:hypothetical protein M0805_004566 [Coniferiporia weirii]|nr:hypothetical protein M0805_004566 [Coniferiporia weirii]
MSTDSAENTNRIRHPTFYFSDGNIVLSAIPAKTFKRKRTRTGDFRVGFESEQKPAVLYKIHKSQLTANSITFREMLSLPTSTDGANDTYDGLPLVEMPDSAEEIEDLLTMLYRSWDFILRRHHPDTCVELSNVLAITTKYQFDSIQKTIVSHVKKDWPSTLKEWDQFSARTRNIPVDEDSSFGKDQPEPASALVLASRYDIKSILSAVYYDLSRLRPVDDWDDHIVASRGCINDEIDQYFKGRKARWQLLNARQLLAIQRGKGAMQNCLGELFLEYSELSGCEKETCVELREKIVRQLEEALERGAVDTLQTLSTILELAEKIERDSGVSACTNCVAITDVYFGGAREKLWEMLPEYFDLDPRQYYQ